MFARDRRPGITLSGLALTLAGGAGLIVATMIGAGLANADQAQDDQYFAALQQIYPGRDLDAAANIGNAHKICDHLGGGESLGAVANAVREADDNKETVAQVQREVQLAKSTYCP